MTAENFLEAARERAADATSILKDRPGSSGSVYVVGYAVECSIKAYMLTSGRKTITSGRAGHNLNDLWKSSGFRKSDLGGSEGAKTFFLETWNTSMRYETTLNLGGQTAEELLAGAKKITSWLHQQIRRETEKRSKRRRQ